MRRSILRDVVAQSHSIRINGSLCTEFGRETQTEANEGPHVLPLVLQPNEAFMPPTQRSTTRAGHTNWLYSDSTVTDPSSRLLQNRLENDTAYAHVQESRLYDP